MSGEWGLDELTETEVSGIYFTANSSRSLLQVCIATTLSITSVHKVIKTELHKFNSDKMKILNELHEEEFDGRIVESNRFM